MTTHIQAAFAVTSWDEKTWEGTPAHEVKGEKLTLARISNTYTGDVQGTSQLEYLMTYRADGSAVYVGLERFEGSVLSRNGSLILQHSGTFDGGAVKGAFTIVSGSGGGELVNVYGTGSLELAGQQAAYPIFFELAFG